MYEYNKDVLKNDPKCYIKCANCPFLSITSAKSCRITSKCQNQPLKSLTVLFIADLFDNHFIH